MAGGGSHLHGMVAEIVRRGLSLPEARPVEGAECKRCFSHSSVVSE